MPCRRKKGYIVVVVAVHTLHYHMVSHIGDGRNRNILLVIHEWSELIGYDEKEAEIYCLSQDEGGRHTPFFSNYRPQFFLRTADVTGNLTLKEGTEMVMPGDNTSLDVELITPVPIEAGLRFNMREGGRTVGTGIITKVID